MPRPPDSTARERILGAAARLFYERGIQAVSMADIVEAARCGKNVLYRHFPSKTDLVAAYLLDFARGRNRAVDAALDGLDDDPGAALVALVRQIAEQAEDARFRGCAIRNYLREFPEHDDAAGRVAVEWLASARRRIDDLTARLGVDDAPALADRIWLVQEGLYAAGARHEPVATSGAAVDLVAALLEGTRDAGAATT